MIDIVEDKLLLFNSTRHERYETIRAYKCPACLNVMLVEFFTTKEVDIKNVEETRLLHTSGSDAGSLREVVPNKDNTNSAYESSFHPLLNLQTLRLKNHVVPSGKVDERYYGSRGERGYTPCVFTAIISSSERLVVRDLMLLSRPAKDEVTVIPPYDILDAANQGLSKPYFVRSKEIQERFPAAILITKSAYTVGFNFKIKPLIDSWLKETVQA